MKLHQAQGLLGGTLTEDELEIIQDDLSKEDLKTLVSLPSKLVSRINPELEKTEDDIPLSLTFSAPMLARPLIGMLFHAYARMGTRGKHPVFKNIRFMKSLPDGRLALRIKLQSPMPWLISHRVTYMTYQLRENPSSEGQKKYSISIKKVNAGNYGLPSLRNTGMVKMATMEGEVSVTERADGGSILRLNVIGNPDISVVPDWILRRGLEGRYNMLTRKGSLHLSEKVFAGCLEQEYETENTICRQGE